MKERPPALLLIFHFLVSIHAPVKERHIVSGYDTGDDLVSIHAPVKERLIEKDCTVHWVVSIHAPVKERPLQFERSVSSA